MRHSTVSTPVESCDASTLNSTSLRFCSLHLLHGQVLYFVVEPKSKTKELYNQACAHFASQGMLDTDLFGIAVVLDDEYLFVDPDYKLSKYAPKSWRSSSTHGLDSTGKPLLAFYFRVQFYVDSPLLLRDETSRHQYYLQLRHNVATRNLAYAHVAEEFVYLLVGLALQADLGDYSESRHNENYFTLPEYFPEQMVGHANETHLYHNAIIVHKANRTLSKAQAETQFIREASSRDSFPLAHNSHLYRLKHKKNEPNPGTLLLAICTKGIELYEEKSSKPINGTFLWNNIGKLCFDRKKFEIRSLNASGDRMIYYTSSDEKSKHLLTLCRLTHQFSMAIQTKLNELTRKEEEERKQFRDWGTELNVKLVDSGYDHNVDQRISVISTTSSNTTSGIVSDRVQSLDESEDDLDLEIMINSPPAASIESLALAHLRDSFSKENRRTNKKLPRNPSPLSQMNAETSGETSEPFSLSKLTLPTSSVTTDGSQCSSSCSTVVVTSYNHEEPKSQIKQPSVPVTNRSHSTTSSLELGYSHTAQNSALSESASCCLEIDYSVQSGHTSSGIYTLQSSCETNTVATTAIAGSSETSGLGQSVVEDSEGIRSRSSSIFSAPGSFHGDGSDPADTGHGTPLTAAELSDLIVGRSPKPCRGKYPSVATVSETLDSVADYVTLPPPPIPPPCRMSFRMMRPLTTTTTATDHRSRTFSPKGSESSSCVARQGSVSNESQHSSRAKYFSEEAMLQRQIQFQHLAAGFSSHMLMNTLPNHLRRSDTLLCPGSEAAMGDCRYTSSYSLRCPEQPQPAYTPYMAPTLRSEETAARMMSSPKHAQPTFGSPKPTLPSYASTGSLNCNQLSSHSQHLATLHAKFADTLIRGDQCASSVPIVGSNNYLDVRRSGAAFLQQIHEKFPPPPPLHYNRQPPPPPPPPPLPPPPPPRNHHYTVRHNLLSHQLDQYRQQLYSDVDYVIYPIKDPAISKQEYLDSKEASGHCSQYLPQNASGSKLPARMHHEILSPPLCSMYDKKSRAMYQSTPNVAMAGGCAMPPPSCYQPYPSAKYASNQNLPSEFSTYSNSSLVYLSNKYPSSTSPLYSTSASMYSSSMQSLLQDSSIYGRILPPSRNCNFSRTLSDDNILNCSDKRAANVNLKLRKPPPPPPPPPYISPKKILRPPEEPIERQRAAVPADSSKFDAANENVSLDISSLREKSKNLDLPLISALCNDKSLLKQTNTADVRNEQSEPQPCATSSWFDFDTKISPENSSKTYFQSKQDVVKGSAETAAKFPGHHPPVNGKASRYSVPPDEGAACDSVGVPTHVSRKSHVDAVAAAETAAKLSSGKKVVAASTAKVKPLNSKLCRSTVSNSKLKYSVSQPVPQNAAVAKPKTARANDTSKNSNFAGKVKCGSSKIKSIDLSAQFSSRSNDVNIA